VTAISAGASNVNWVWRLILGIIAIILGLFSLGSVFVTTLASTVVIGILLLVGAVLQAIAAFRGGGLGRVLLHIGMAIVMVIGGLWLIGAPVIGAITLTFALAAMLFLGGAFYAIYAIVIREPNWVWALITGLVAVVLGVLMFIDWPGSGLVTIGMFVGLLLIFEGIEWIVGAFTSR
jgi:uncharacterized membrane protein HdeD (DUF308 family)